jgi:probable phosphoglycerate mutase
LDFELVESLYEFELGSLVGNYYDDIIKKLGNFLLSLYNENDSTLTRYGVESFGCVKRRIKNILEEILVKDQNKNVLLITHLDPIKAALSTLLDLKPEALYQWHIRNAALTILKHDGRNYSLSGVNVMGLHRYPNE